MRIIILFKKNKMYDNVCYEYFKLFNILNYRYILVY